MAVAEVDRTNLPPGVALIGTSESWRNDGYEHETYQVGEAFMVNVTHNDKGEWRTVIRLLIGERRVGKIVWRRQGRHGNEGIAEATRRALQ